MPADIFFESDDSEFSETDLSVHGRKGRTSFRRRSVSRHRRPEARETLMVPVQSTRVHRSASTGGRRNRDRNEVPAVMIVNEQAQRTDNSNTNKPRRVQQKVVEPEWEEEVILPRRRAVTGVSRDPSPFHHDRDTELALNQKLLEKSDLRQDMEIWKQQQEIERLERELEKHRDRAEPRDPRESRLLREEEEWYEDEISDRLRRLERFERKNRAEEERRNAEKEWRLKRLEDQEREAADQKAWRLKRLEEAEKEAADREELKQKLRNEKLKELAKQKEEEEERERLRKELQEEKMKELAKQKAEAEAREKLRREFLEEERRKAAEAEEKKKKEQAMKLAAIEEWKLEQERIKQKQREEAIKKDKEFRERLRLEFGYTEDEIEEILNKKKKAEKEKEKKKEDKKDEIIEEKTTWIKVHRKHLLPETLLAYNLPWDWDERDSNYIIIKRWITEDFQEELFAHTRRIREGKLVAQTSSSTTELKINDRNKDKMYLVRKKSPSRRLRIFA
ncbi:hypothetical protein PoHVEF18_003579 [Penicillium ochrochloron]